MSSQTPRRALFAALLLPLLGGCFVTSENPVLRAGEDGRDPALRGLWVSDTGREVLHVLRPGPAEGQAEAPGFSGLYVVSDDGTGEARDNWTGLRLIATRVKDRGILSMKFSGGEGDNDTHGIEGWLVFIYEIRDGRLYLFGLEVDAVDAAIEAGDLKGTPKSDSSSPHVTASAAEWIAFLEKADLATLFTREESDPLYKLAAETIQGAVGAKKDED